MINYYQQYYPPHPPVPMYQNQYPYPYPYPYTYSYPIREFPPVNPQMFVNSAKKMSPLLKDAEMLMDQIAKSASLSQKIMAAAQESKSTDVEKLIYGTGITSKPEIKYTPTGLIITFSNNEDEPGCCHLQIRMRWGM